MLNEQQNFNYNDPQLDLLGHEQRESHKSMQRPGAGNIFIKKRDTAINESRNEDQQRNSAEQSKKTNFYKPTTQQFNVDEEFKFE